MREPGADNPALGNDDCANNNFEFNADGEEVPKVDAEDCSDEVFNPTVGDTDETAGLRCPFAGHIRKAYPRDDEGTSDRDPHSGKELNENTTQMLVCCGAEFRSSILIFRSPIPKRRKIRAIAGCFSQHIKLRLSINSSLSSSIGRTTRSLRQKA